MYIYEYINYNDLTGIMVSKGNHPQIALFQMSQILAFTQIHDILKKTSL